MKSELIGKIVLVTGGSRGIGRATAVTLAKAVADVAVNYQRMEADAQTVCQEIQRRVRSVPSGWLTMLGQRWFAQSLTLDLASKR